MVASPQRIRIDNQSFQVEKNEGSRGPIRWYRAQDEDRKTCFIGQLPISAAINVEEVLAALPLALRIQHPNVQTLVAAEYSSNQPGQIRFVVREPPTQSTLRAEVEGGQTSEARARTVLIQLTKAIAARAAFPFGHGCLAPEHVLTLGSHQVRMVHPWIIWLLDTIHRSQTSGTSNWEYTWLAPECIQQQAIADLISDCYSACALTFAMLTGKTHVDADSALVLDQEIGSEELPNVRAVRADCSPAFADLLGRGLDPSRKQRPQSPGELLTALENLAPLPPPSLPGSPSFTADLGDLSTQALPEPEPPAQSQHSNRLGTHRGQRGRTTTQRERGNPSNRIRRNDSQPSAGLIGGIFIGATGVIGALIIMGTSNTTPAPQGSTTYATNYTTPSPPINSSIQNPPPERPLTSETPVAEPSSVTQPAASDLTDHRQSAAPNLKTPGYLQPTEDEAFSSLPPVAVPSAPANPQQNIEPEPAEPTEEAIPPAPVSPQQNIEPEPTKPNEETVRTAPASPQQNIEPDQSADTTAEPSSTTTTLASPQATPPTPPNLQQIFLTAGSAQASDQERTWRLHNSEHAFSQQYWESINQPYTHWRDRVKVRKNLPNLDRLTFTFEAQAGVPYHYWVRAKTIAQKREKGYSDALFIHFETPIAWSKRPYLGGTKALWPGLARLNGFGFFDTEWCWVSAHVPRGNSSALETDREQSSITFTNPGQQTLSIYLDEGPMRIDGIWLSQTQATRPDWDFNPQTLIKTLSAPAP